MDTRFIGQPHEWDPRRLYSQTGVDWQYRVDFERLRKDRLARVREQMTKRDIGAMVLFAGANIRYITGSYQGNWKYNINIRYAVLPNGGEPILFETAGSDLHCAEIDLPWMEGRIRPAITWQWAEGAVPYMAERMVGSVVEVLKEHNLTKEKIAVDNFDMAAYKAFTAAGLNVVDAWPLMSGARTIKTRDEIELLKMASSIGDAAMWKVKYEWLKPGVREREIDSKVHEFMLERGCEIIYDIIVASGGNTSPYRRWATDKVIRQGDLVIVDINAVGPSGYFIDFVRCFKCGGQKMTQKEIDLYKEVYDSMYAGIEQLKPGNTTADVASKFPEYDDDKYGTVTLQQFAHSIGLTLYEGMWISRAYSLKYPAEIKENMYFAIETFAGHPGLQQTARLEENVLVTGKGPVVFTLMEHMEEAMKNKMASKLVAVTDSVFPNLDPARAVLKKVDADLQLASAPTPEAILQVAKDADAILTTYAKVTADMIPQLSRCKIIGRFGIGVDNVDLPAATAKGIVVTRVPDYCLDEVSDHAMALLLAVVRKIPFLSARAHAGTWEMKAAVPIHRLRGTTLGLVAFGQIPQLMAPKAKSFGMNVITYDPYVPQEVLDKADVKRVELDELIKASDYISIHTPLMPATHHMFNADAFKRMKPTAYIINTARGPIIDEAALAEALDKKEIAGAALDVMEKEPTTSSPLFGRDNVIITPHSSFYSDESLVDLQTKAAEEVVRVLTGQAPKNAVNPEALKSRT